MPEEKRRFAGLSKRLVLGALVGVGLAVAAILFVQNIYDPFTSDIEDLRSLIPADVDFMVEVRDFPTLMKGLEDRPFFSRLDRNRSFQRFLDSQKVAETRVVPALREAYHELRQLTLTPPEIPFGLEVLGDVSGSQVVIGGYEPQSESDPVRFLAAIKPESATAIMAANCLLSETLCDWFIRDRLQGMEVEHYNWGAKLTMRHQGGSFEIGLARIENALVVGSDLRALTRLVKRAKTEGLDGVTPARFNPGWVWQGAPGSSVNVMIERESFDRHVGVTPRFLVPLWGTGLAGVFDRFLPGLNGRDVYLKLDLGEYAEVRAGVGSSPRTPLDPFTAMDAMDLGAAHRQIDGVLDKLPHYVFGYSYFAASPGALARFSLYEPELVLRDEKELLFDTLSTRVPRFRVASRSGGGIPDLTERIAAELDACFDPEIGLVLFKKHRDEETLDSEFGMAAVLKIKDRARLEAFIREMDDSLDSPLDRYDDWPGMTAWNVSKTAWLDDPNITKPGFAIMGDHFVLTNWFPLLRDSVAVERGTAPGFASGHSRDLLAYNLDQLEEGSRGFVFIDPERLYAFMDSAKEAWAESRSEISQEEMRSARRLLEIRAGQEGIPPAQRDSWIHSEFDHWRNEQRREKNPQRIRQEIERNLDYFRGAFLYFFSAFGARDEAFLGRVALGAREEAF